MKSALVFLLTLLAMSFALADGAFAKLNSVERPGIPFQRAIVAHRDGVERMVVESTLRGTKGDYVWIVPVPSPPTRVMAVNEEAMARVGYSYRPAVGKNTEFLAGLWRNCGLWLLLLGIGIASVGFRARHRASDLTIAGVAALAGVMAAAVLAPVYAGSKAAGLSDGVRTLSSQRAGNYRVEVLEAEGGSALRAWLAKRGGTLNREAQATVDAYVRDGWCFVAAQLRPHGGGEATPHPLALEFRCERPVYPMRLTGTQKNDLLLELYVVADGTATVEPLRRWRSLTLPANRLTSVEIDKDVMLTSPLRAVSWPGATVTRLRGVVKPVDMRRDYHIRVGKPEAMQIRLALAKDVKAYWAGIAVFGAGLATLLIASILAFRGASRPKRLVAAIAVGCLAGAVLVANGTPGMKEIEPGVYQVD